MRTVLCAIALAIPVVVFTQAPADSVSPRAKQLHDRAIVVDTHVDTTQRLINYHAAFLSEEFRVASEKKNGNVLGAIDAVSKKCGGNEACATMEGERIDHSVCV